MTYNTSKFLSAYFILNSLICALASGVQHLLFRFYSIVLNSMKETQNKRPGSILHKYWICSVESISILLLSKLLPVSTKACCRMHITPSPGRLPTHGLTSLVGSNGSIVPRDGSSAGWLELPTFGWDAEECHTVGQEAGILTWHLPTPRKICPEQLKTWAGLQCHQAGDANHCKANEASHMAPTTRGASVPAWLLCCPMGLPGASPQGHMAHPRGGHLGSP